MEDKEEVGGQELSQDQTDSGGDNETKASENGGGKFKLGLDSGSELLDELTFSLQHGGGSGASQPPPGHWVSQPQGNHQQQYRARLSNSHFSIQL